MTDNRRVQIETVVDTTGARAGFNEVAQEAGRMAAGVTQAGANASQAVAGIGAAASGAAQATNASQSSIVQSVQRSTAQIAASERNLVAMTQRTIASLDAGARSGSAFIESLARTRGVDATRGPLAQQLAQLRAIEQAQTRVGASAAQTAQAMRQLPAQVSDIFVGLQGGQSPLTVLLQQGSQLRDSFGGTGAAARALGGELLGMLNPTTALAAGVTALGFAYKSGADEIAGFGRALALTNNATGATVDQLSDMARQIGAVSGSRGNAAEALTALTSTGKVPVENLKQFAAVTADVQRIIGRSVEETAGDFAELGKAPLAALDKLDEKYHFVNATIYAQVKALQDQGKASEAADLAQQAYADGIAKQKQAVLDSLTDWERGWIRIKTAVSGAVDSVVDFASGRGQVNSEKIQGLLDARQGLEERVERLKKRGAARDGDKYNPETDPDVLAAKAALDANLREINAIRDKDKAQKDAVKTKTDAQKIDDAQKQWAKDADQFLDRVTQREREIKVARELGAEANLKSKDIEDRVAAIRKKYADTYNIGIESNIAALERRAQVEDAIAQRTLARIAAERALGAITEQDAINQTAEAELATLDRTIATRRRELAQISQKVTATPAQKTNELNDKETQIEVLRIERANREQKRQNDLALLAQKRAQDSDELFNKGIVGATAERDALQEALGVQLDYNQAVGLTKYEVADVKAQHLLRSAALKDEIAATQEAIPGGEQLAAIYREQAQLLRDSASATLGGSARDSAKELHDFLDPTKAQTFGEALRDAFGAAGDGLTKLTGALKQYGARQIEIEKFRGESARDFLNGKKTEGDYLKDLDGLNRKSAQSQVAAYGDMAGAAAGFFGEQSKGYKALMAVSQVFHAAELAMTTAELVPKAISAVLTQGQGDPYTAFARMAAMTALVAGLGVAVGGGGGGGDLSKQRQETQGTGTVLGDSSAKSESIQRAIEAVEKNTYQDLAINTSMLASLRSIDNNIVGFASQLVQSTDVTGKYAATTGTMGGFVGKIVNGLFGGKTSVQDTGFTLDPTSLGSALAQGVQAYQYSDMHKSGGLFGSSKNWTDKTALGDDANRQFGQIIASLAESVTEAGSMLGVSGTDFTDKLNAFVIDIGKVSLKDLKGDELQKALQAVFSKLGDNLAQFAVGGLGILQKVGEGYLETLVRVATEYQTVDVVFQSFGKTFGMVGVASVEARDRLVQLAGGLDEFTSQGEYFLTNFFSEKEQAAAMQRRIDPTLAKYGLSSSGDDASKLFRDFVVGLDTTTKAGAETYTELMAIAPALKTVVDAQKDAMESILDQRKDLQDQLDELTMTSTQLREKERAAIDDSNKALYDQIQVLKDQAKAAEDQKAAIEAAKSAATSLLGGVDGAFSVLQKVVQREKDVLQKRIDKEAEAVNLLKSLTDSISSTLDSMSVAGSDALGRQSAQAQIKDALALVRGGAQLSDDQIKNLGKALSAVSQDSTKQFGSKEDYLFDFLTTRNDIAQLGDLTGDQLSAEEKSLEQLKASSEALDGILSKAQEQIDVLKGISTTGLSIEQALNGLTLSIATAQQNPVVSATGAITKAYQDSLGRAPDQAGLEYWQNAAAGGTSIDQIVGSIGNSMEAQVAKLYQSLLGRQADGAGLAYYLRTGGSLADIASSIKASDEYKDHQKKLGIPGYASGGLFGGGLRIVGENGPELEATGPSRIWSSNQTAELLARASSPAGNSAALVEAVRDLKSENARQRSVIEDMAKDMAAMARILKGVSPSETFIKTRSN